MTNKTARIKFEPSTGALEIEGTEEFVREMFVTLREAPLLPRRNQEDAPTSKVDRNGTGPDAAAGPGTHTEFPSTFGEYLQGFTPENDVDRILIAARYAQHVAADNAFQTAEANRLLKEQGIKVGNPSQSVKRGIAFKRIFSVTKGSYRISRDGEDYLKTLRRHV